VRKIGGAALKRLGVRMVSEVQFSKGRVSDPKVLRFWAWYLRVARFLATRGIAPPLSLRSRQMAERWRDDPPSSPSSFLQQDSGIHLLFSDVLPLLEKDSPILELGCNVGRALQYLRDRGYTCLTGVEIGKEALELMESTFPGLRSAARIIEGNAPEVLKTFPDKSYELVFTKSVLTNLGVKYNYVFAEMCRVSRRFILTMENENHCLSYPRDIRALIERGGFKEVVCRIVRPDSTPPVPFTDMDLFKTIALRLFVVDESA